MSAKYEHRNGESDLPTIEGWYWFRGTVDEKKGAGLVKVNLPDTAFPTHTVSPMWIDGWIESELLSGQWWGPVTPPWNHDNE